MKRRLILSDAEKTKRLAVALAEHLSIGDTVLLNGEIGAGKSFFSRAAIQSLMANVGALEDVPSPTFTLVQTYTVGDLEIWHADLYRLTQWDELIELGLDDAFESAVCLVEWADRLGSEAPANALTLDFVAIDDDTRELKLEWADPKWDSILQKTITRFEQPA